MEASGEGPSWSDIAVWYDELIAAGSGPHETALNCMRGLLPALQDACVLDLACGQGLATRAVAEAGARRVVGVDASDEMVRLARSHRCPPGSEVTYTVDDAQRLDLFESETFDGVTCQLGLMDISDLRSVLAAVHRVLKARGWFVFVIGHPCYLVPEAYTVTSESGRPGLVVTGYFQERFWRSANPSGVRRAGNYHRMLSTYLNTLTVAGFGPEEVAEPVAAPRLHCEQAVYGEVPIFFAGRYRRQ